LAVDDAVELRRASRLAQAALQQKNEKLHLRSDVNNTIGRIELRDLLSTISASLSNVMQCDGVSVALPEGEDRRLRFHALNGSPARD